MKRKLNEQDVPEEPKTEASSPITFTSSGLDARLIRAVNEEKFTTPTPIQANAIPLVLSGKDVLARAKTGSGKTLAYLLPTLQSILQSKAASKTLKRTSVLILVPTKELARQVLVTVKKFTAFCGQDIRGEDITRKEDDAVTRARLAEKPDVVVATPSRAAQWANEEALLLDDLRFLVIDEADLVLSYGYEDDLRSLASAIPTGAQAIMMSATLRTETDTLTSLFCRNSKQPPILLDLGISEAAEKATLAQYVVRTAEEDKFLLLYAFFKLKLVKGKVILFVADTDRCYRVKLFLEQFGIRSCVLNSELPVNSRLHAVEEFNKGVYDIIIAADEAEVVGMEDVKRSKRRKTTDDDEVEGEEDTPEQEKVIEEDAKASAGLQDEGDEPRAPRTKKSQRRKEDPEYGVSRGLDFQAVSCVLNFDLPTTSKSYTHRVGRTARAGQTGMAVSFFVPSELHGKNKSTTILQCANDEKVLAKIKQKQESGGAKIEDWNFDLAKLEGFRYRLSSALKNVTRMAVREARTRELRNELINSTKLKRHFEENPADLRHLRHDTETRAVRAQPHLKHVPDYLLPQGGQRAVAADVGFVGLRKDKENRLRKARSLNKGRNKAGKGKGLDPLKSLNMKGRGKK